MKNDEALRFNFLLRNKLSHKKTRAQLDSFLVRGIIENCYFNI